MEERISITVQADTAQATSALAQFGTQVSEMAAGVGASSSSIGGAFNTLSGMVGKAFAGIGSFISDFIVKFRYASIIVGGAAITMIKDIVNIGANVEQTRVAFATLLQSEPQAGNLMEWLTKYSLVTPLTRAQLQETARTFLAYGHNLDQTKIAVQAVTEATSALGISQDRITAITQNLGKIFTSTQASLRHVNFEMWQGVPVGKLLAQAVNEGALKLSDMGGAASGAATVTKTMTTAYKNASGDLQILQDKLKKTQLGLDDYSKQSKKTEEGTLSHKIAVESAQRALDKAKSSISSYTAAMNSHSSAVAVAKTKYTELTQEQIKDILASNKGKDVALALEKQLLQTFGTFGEAASKQVKTFAGMMSNFADVFQYVVQRAMGISLSGEVIVGGAFYTMREAASSLISFLINHIDEISTFFNTLLSSKDVLVGIAGALVGMLIPAFAYFVGPVALAGAAIGFLSAKIYDWLSVSGNLANVLRILGTVITAISGIFNFLKSNIDYIIGAFKSLGTVLGVIMALNFQAVLAALVGGLMQLLYPLASLIMTLGPFGILIIAVSSAIGIFTSYLNRLKDQGILSQNAFIALKIALQSIIPILAVINALLNANPIGAVIIAVAALTAGFIALYTQTDILKSKTMLVADAQRDLMRAQDALKRSTDAVRDAEDSLVGANLRAREQAVQVTMAQKNYNDMVKQFGPNSLEAQQASLNLEQAQYDLGHANDEVTAASQRVIDKQNEEIQNSKKVEESSDKLKEKVASQGTVWDDLSNKIRNALDWLDQAAKKGALGAGAQAISGIISSIPHKQHGGVVEGPPGMAVPIIAHGGERVIPSGGESGGGGGGGNGVVINFSGAVNMDSEQRVQQLADKIIRVIGRQNELSRYGVGFNFI